MKEVNLHPLAKAFNDLSYWSRLLWLSTSNPSAAGAFSDTDLLHNVNVAKDAVVNIGNQEIETLRQCGRNPDALVKFLALVQLAGPWDKKGERLQSLWIDASPLLYETVAATPQTPPDANGSKELAPPANQSAKRWTLSTADTAIKKYIIDNEQLYKLLTPRCKASDKAAIAQAKSKFGRNAIHKALDIPAGTISKCQAWLNKINSDLFANTPHDPLSGLRRTGLRQGLAVAIDEAGQRGGDVTANSVMRNETIALINRSNMPKESRDQIIAQLELGAIDDVLAREWIDTFNEGERERARDRQAERNIDSQARRVKHRSRRQSDQ